MADFVYKTCFQSDTYAFCSNHISSYEKTIYILAIAYGANPLCSLDNDDIQGLAYFLEVNFEMLVKALSNRVNFTGNKAKIKFGDEVVDCESFFSNTFFDVIIKVYFIYKNLEKISESFEEELVIENIHIFTAITSLFDMVNYTVSTYECMANNEFSYKSLIYDSSEHFYPKGYIDFLTLHVSSGDCMDYDRNILCVVTALLKYEFRTRINVLYLITICQIFKHSPCFSHEKCSIATSMYEKLLYILKNGRMITMNVNVLYCDLSTHFSERSRFNNTTRLQLIYGYSNYDCYELRLDFSHKGQEYVHLNNQSPGGLSCCIFNEEEYKSVLDDYPQMKDFFISYDDRWALKEKSNCEFSEKIAEIYDNISRDKSHGSIFAEDLSEETINEFIESVAKMLPKECRKAIDLDGHFVRSCFNYDIIMRDVTLLYFTYITQDTDNADSITNQIVDKAYRYKLITEKFKIETFKEVYEIMKEAEEKIK